MPLQLLAERVGKILSNRKEDTKTQKAWALIHTLKKSHLQFKISLTHTHTPTNSYTTRALKKSWTVE